MKSASAAWIASLSGEEHTVATCVRLARTDGVIKGFTDHDRDLVLSGQTYTSAGFTRSAIATQSSLATDTVDLEALIDDVEIAADDIRAGLYDGASVQFFLADWADPSKGIIKLRAGTLGEVTLEDGRYQAELRGLLDKYGQNIGRLYTAGCPARVGDSQCTVDLAPFTVAGSVTAPGADRRSWVDPARGEPDRWFDGGVLTWSSGLNAGLSMEVKSYVLSTQALTLFLPMPFAVQTGDTYTLTPGCDGRLTTCKNKFDNVVNFRGFPYVPGVDAMVTYPDADGTVPCSELTSAVVDAGTSESPVTGDDTPPPTTPTPPGAGALSTPPSTSTTFTVTNTNNAGAGSLRQALTDARSAGGSARIEFTVGGTLSLLTHLPALDRPTIVILGDTAPSTFIIDGTSCAAPSDGRGIIDIIAPNGFVRGLRLQNFTHSGLDGVRVKWNGSGTILEDLEISQWGTDEGVAISQNCLNVQVNRVTCQGTRGVRAFLVHADSAATLTDCLVDGCRGGYFAGTRSHLTLKRCESRQSHYGLWADRGARATVDEATFEDLSDVGLYADGATIEVLDSLIQRVDGRGIRARTTTSLATTVKVEATTIQLCTTYGAQAENRAVLDLGGGSLGSTGGNTMQLNTPLDVQNSTSPLTTLKAEGNTWDHSTVASVQGGDVSASVDVDPLAP
jgi:uncharacterized phage protein (TIGR02218 family)